MEQPPATLVIQGVLRPAFSEEHSVIQRHLSSRHSSNGDINEAQKHEDNLENHGMINRHDHESSSSKDGLNLADGLDGNIPMSEASFYRLEMIKIQLFTGHAHPVCLISVLILQFVISFFFTLKHVFLKRHNTSYLVVRMSSSLEIRWPLSEHLQFVMILYLSCVGNIGILLFLGRKYFILMVLISVKKPTIYLLYLVLGHTDWHWP